MINDNLVHFSRFGMINAVKTKQTSTVRKGEELYVSYGYPITLDLAWYKEQFEQFRKKHPQLARQMMNRSGISRKDKGRNDHEPMMTALTNEAEKSTQVLH